VAIKFAGDFEVPRPPEEVYDFLTDPNRFAPLLPGFLEMSSQNGNRFMVKVNVGVSYIKGAADVKMELSESERPRRALYKGQGSMAGGGLALTAGFDLSPTPGGTKVAWQGETQVFGRLASLAGGLLEPLGKKNAQKLIDGLQAALTSAAAVPATQLSSAAEGPTPGSAPAPAAEIPESAEHRDPGSVS